MNPYFSKLEKIEFVVTYACTGQCKHCSESDHAPHGVAIEPDAAAETVRRVAEEYRIRTVMAFGGESLLYPESVYAIMRAAKESGVPHRQVITNGYFSKDDERISAVASKLAECGVNDLLLSVDAFHQETIPIDTVKAFAREAKHFGIPVRLQPAWLVNPSDDNLYNLKTREILREFSDMDVAVGEGNVIFPEGNALKYLAEYFTEVRPENPYEEDPRDVRCISFSPDGSVLNGNICKTDIMDILEGYDI